MLSYVKQSGRSSNLFKYVHKGSDMAVICLQNPDQPPDPHQYDEIKKYQISRYMCTGEAIWRILKFNINEHYPSVEKLAVHLENDQRIYFNDTEQARRIVANDPPQTTLTGLFQALLRG